MLKNIYPRLIFLVLCFKTVKNLLKFRKIENWNQKNKWHYSKPSGQIWHDKWNRHVKMYKKASFFFSQFLLSPLGKLIGGMHLVKTGKKSELKLFLNFFWANKISFWCWFKISDCFFYIDHAKSFFWPDKFFGHKLKF